MFKRKFGESESRRLPDSASFNLFFSCALYEIFILSVLVLITSFSLIIFVHVLWYEWYHYVLNSLDCSFARNYKLQILSLFCSLPHSQFAIVFRKPGRYSDPRYWLKTFLNFFVFVRHFRRPGYGTHPDSDPAPKKSMRINADPDQRTALVWPGKKIQEKFKFIPVGRYRILFHNFN